MGVMNFILGGSSGYSDGNVSIALNTPPSLRGARDQRRARAGQGRRARTRGCRRGCGARGQ